MNKKIVALKISQCKRGMWKDYVLVDPDFSDDYERDSSCDPGLRGAHRLKVTLCSVLPSHELLTAAENNERQQGRAHTQRRYKILQIAGIMHKRRTVKGCLLNALQET